MDNNSMFGENRENTTGENSMSGNGTGTGETQEYSYAVEKNAEEPNTSDMSTQNGQFSSVFEQTSGQDVQSNQYAYESQINQGSSYSYGNPGSQGSSYSYGNSGSQDNSYSYGNQSSQGNTYGYGNQSSQDNSYSYTNQGSQGNTYSYGNQGNQGNSYSYGSNSTYGNNNTYTNNSQGNGAPNYYAPNYNNTANQNTGYHGYEPELEEPVKMSEWLLLQCLIMFIPCVGWIMAIVWAFSKTEKKSKVNYCKAYLIVLLIRLALTMVILLIYGGVIFAALSAS